MSKKKKKKVPLSLRQKLKNLLTAALNGAAAWLQPAAARVRAGVRTAGTAVHQRMYAFLQYKWSTAPVTVFFLLLALLTCALFGYHYLTSSFPLTFVFAIPFYLIDYRVGFVSRALIGQIISLLTDSVSLSLVFAVARVAVILSIVLQATLAAAAFKKAFLKGNYVASALCVFFACAPAAVLPLQIYLGFLDVYNLLLAIFYVYISDTKAAPFLAPLICVTGIVIHYQFVIAFLPVICMLELYHICRQKQGRTMRIVSFCFTLLLSAGTAVYLIFFAKHNVRMDVDSLMEAMRNKFSDYNKWGLYEDYFTFYIYGDYNGMNYSAPADLVNFLLHYSLDRLDTKRILGYFAGLLPLFALPVYFWICLFRHAEKGRKLPYLVFMLQPLVFVVSAIISTDTGRWACAAAFSGFALLYTAVKCDGADLTAAARRLQKPWVFLPLCAVLIAAYCIALFTVKTTLN